jgi:hypothetical protein
MNSATCRRGGVDVDAALRERTEQLAREASDLGLPVHDLTPPDPQPVSELGTQQRLVQPAQRPLLTLQVPGIERVPRSVGGLDLGGDHGVGVDLGVVVP